MLNCAICRNSTYCIGCNEGFYLMTYNNQFGRGETQCIPCSTLMPFCTSCYDQQNSIVCNRCINGYALSQNMCVVNNCTSRLCLNGCDSSSICNDCIDGRLGQRCDVCFRNGTCALGCKEGLEGDTCTQKTFITTTTFSSSVTVTTRCPATCDDSGCDDKTGDCYACQPGYYGPKCDQDCGLCVKENCSSRACTAGYTQLFSGPDSSFSKPCVPNCAFCSMSAYCTMCNEGFYLKTYINSYGNVEIQCSPCSASKPFCTSCYNQKNEIVCNRCTNGYALLHNNCVVNNCPNNVCLNGCDSSGICNGCLDGRLGPRCNYLCNIACANCSTQNICEKCHNNFYSQTCLQPCNSNCLSINNPTCNFIDGKCSFGCNNGFWGDWCDNKCSDNCKDFAGGLSVCFRNESCALGYKNGFDEENTYTQTTFVTTTTTSSSVIKIKECESSPCEKGATCIDKVHGFSCIYAPEYKENERYIAATGGLSAVLALLFVVLVVLAIHKLRSRSEGVSFKVFCCCRQKTKDETETYASLQIQQPGESNEYDVMESTLSVNVGIEPETIQSQNRVE